MRKVMAGTLAVLMLVAAVRMVRVAAAEEADCEDLSLRFNVGFAEPYCRAGTERGRSSGGGAMGWALEWQFMGADSKESSRGVNVAIGNRWSWATATGVKARIEEAQWFTKLSGWGEPYKLEGYEVVRFDGTWGESSRHCAGFLRYSVPSGDGYREFVRGYFCVWPHVKIYDETLRDFLRSIEY